MYPETPSPFTIEKRIYIFLLGIVIFVLVAWSVAPPRAFPSGSIVNVPEGSNLRELSLKLEEDGVIRSPFVFQATAIMLGGEHDMKAGDYYLSHPQSPFLLAWRIHAGKHGIEMVKVTVPEGFTTASISELFDKRFPLFDNSLFERIAPEGYLFPDTYFMPITATATSTIKVMKDNFIRQIFSLMKDVETSGKDLEDIIVMASLIEGETNNQVDREMVSDVLWKRLKIGMPLQVDVDKTTYEFQGLPEAPINNPGLLSIQAALHPTTTPYLYYLTGDDGKMYYSKTFDEHVIKKQQYIN